jgi:hypothetical protein
MRAFTGEPVLTGEWLVWLAQHIWIFALLWITCAIRLIWKFYKYS